MIILVGMMGAGKSTVGKKLADKLGLEFKDTDTILQNTLGRPSSQLFKLFGEESFRGHETAILRKLNPQDGVLATGGGIVTRDENWTEMRRLGTTVFLDVSAGTLEDRLALSKRKRPLLESDNWPDTLQKLLTQRRPMYEQADITIKVTDEEFDQVVEMIIHRLNAPRSEP